jgi:O-methyltransferase involved in polyketide biosynthesis
MKPKSTAETVLLGVWLTICDHSLRSLPNDLIDFTRQMVKATGNPAFYLFRFSLFRWIVHRVESKTLPGVCAHYAARKGAIQSSVESIGNQILMVFGGGLDGLAYRMAPTMPTFELDQPEMQAQKRKLLDALPRRDITFIPSTLPCREAIPTFAEPATFVVEGVFMYLSDSEVEQVLSDLPSGCSLIFTFVGLDESGRPAMGANQQEVDRLLAKLNEPFRWGCHPEDISAFLTRNQFQLNQISGVGFQSVEGMIDGEWIAYANKL